MRGNHRNEDVPTIIKSEAFFSYLIRFIRRQSGCSQTQIAHRSGFSSSYICGVENGQAFRNIVKTHQIINVLGYRPETLHKCTARVIRLHNGVQTPAARS
jgi:transcriptional regulator with XRE-family HTH domain